MNNALKDLPAWGISLLVNLSILAVMGMIVQTSPFQSKKSTITSAVEEEIKEEEYNFSEATIEDKIGNQGETMSMTPTMQKVSHVGQETIVPITRTVAKTVTQDMIKLPEMLTPPQIERDFADAVDVAGDANAVVPGGTEGVMDRVTLEIKRSLAERQTMVIWLFDASGSLNDRRAAMADRFENVYKQLEKINATGGLYTVVASYGEGADLLTPEPIVGNNIGPMVEAVKNIKVDMTGKENVFAATNLCMEKFKKFNPDNDRTNRLIFVVTDERGDDFVHLEETINRAKQNRFRIYCVGNGSIFGQKQSYVRWTYEDGFEQDIPVDGGPESAFAEVIQLPFFGSGGDWRLRQMSAGYGPYTMTRLCAETGGLYLLTEQSRGYQFDPAQMRAYAPDYRPIPVIAAEIAKSPTKFALKTAAEMTYEDGGIPNPETTFRGYSDNVLREDLTEAQKPVAVTEAKLATLFNILEQGEKTRDKVVEPRWRASYDLAMGRILAMRVRFAGYNRMLAMMKSNPKSFETPTNNMWHLVPSSEIETGPQMKKYAESARTYLKRVIDENPGTPWAKMAEVELAQDVGWKWTESRRNVAGMQGRGNLTPEQENLLLLEEDMKKMQERTRQRAVVRTPPKL
ncbi:MAG: vWA domain-containing protein [Planctomycetaceae bacterium]